jgi:2,3-bisphosphoglycerate-independent phosphoglycerate mutase
MGTLYLTYNRGYYSSNPNTLRMSLTPMSIDANASSQSASLINPLVLLVLDGWGMKSTPDGNAIAMAGATTYQHLLDTYPWLAIQASGLPVGLPDGQMGNSEVGHLNMGAGRVVYQELTRINKSIVDGDFFENPVFLAAMAHVKQHNSTLHLMGLLSDGGVHSHSDHLDALIRLSRDQAVDKLCVHAFLDGRDVSPKSAMQYLTPIEATLLEEGFPQITTVCGRYTAMDRDNRWDRTEQAYNNLVLGNGNRQTISTQVVEKAYLDNITDEFIAPCVTDLSFEGMADNDAVIFINFRPDRARQLTQALTATNFTGFNRKKVVNNLHMACMCVYDDTYNLPVAYPKVKLDQLLGQVVSDHGLTQFRTAETEKYAHVTFFFNGGKETPYPGEERLLVASPKVATYDMQPEMSLHGVTDALVNAITSRRFNLIVCNFANPDMVGHTGQLPAAISAVQAVDASLKRVLEAVLSVDGTWLLTADHGNCETMIDDHGGPHTAHTIEPVPLVLISSNPTLKLFANDAGKGLPTALGNIAPTILQLMGLPIPSQMTSPSLLQPVLVRA